MLARILSDTFSSIAGGDVKWENHLGKLAEWNEVNQTSTL